MNESLECHMGKGGSIRYELSTDIVSGKVFEAAGWTCVASYQTREGRIQAFLSRQ